MLKNTLKVIINLLVGTIIVALYASLLISVLVGVIYLGRVLNSFKYLLYIIKGLLGIFSILFVLLGCYLIGDDVVQKVMDWRVR